jgi:glyoxylase-like metal-dependent hydrolase (beta-lactamase superfamily II)
VKRSNNGVDRRGFLHGLATAGGLGALARIGFGGIAGFAAGALRAQGVPATGTRLVLLGTQGGPNFNTERNECSSAVVVDGQVYMVECGYGALGALRESGLGFRDVDNIFLTHLHDDHTADLPALLSHQWTDGRVDPALVIGPYGTEAMVAAALEFSRTNTIPACHKYTGCPLEFPVVWCETYDNGHGGKEPIVTQGSDDGIGGYQRFFEQDVPRYQ